jgi:hypothetical protein
VSSQQTIKLKMCNKKSVIVAKLFYHFLVKKDPIRLHLSVVTRRPTVSLSRTSSLSTLFNSVRVGEGSPVQFGPVHGPARSTVRFTGRHGPFLSEGRTDSPLDRTVVGHKTVHGPTTVRSCPVHGYSPVRNGLDRPVHFKPLSDI